MVGRRGLFLSLLLLSLVVIGLTVLSGATAGYAGPIERPDDLGTAGDELPADTNETAQIWKSEIVDMPGYFDYMSDRSLRFDSAGNAHLVFGGDRLYYAVFDGASWQIETVDTDVGTGLGASLDLDADGQPHISYLDLANYKLKYAHKQGNTWSVQVLDKAYPYEERTSIAVDASGRPHIAYKQQDWQPPDYCPGMGYASWTGSQWTIERFSDCGHFVSLALDSAATPHITFNNSGAIQHATKLAGIWQIDDVSASYVDYGSSVAVDASDRPHVVYVGSDGSTQLIYARWDGSQWVSQTVQAADAGLNLSLALDETGVAYIADGANYIVLNGEGALSINSPSYPSGSFSSIALDALGRPAISYLGANSMVRCNRWDGDEWISELIAFGGSAGHGNSLDLDSLGAPHISYYTAAGWSGGAIRYAWKNGGSWSTETITGTYMPAYVDSEYDTSLVVDSNDVPHVSFWYSEYYDDGLYYGTRSGESWQLEKVAEDADGPNDLALDGAGRPHIAFVDNGALIYGYRDSGGWHVSDSGIEAIPPVVSMKVDGADRPRILYAAMVDGIRALMIAAWTGSEWAVDEIVSVDGSNWLEGTLVLDAADKAHVAYVVASEDNGSELRYAVKEGDGWTSDVVDAREWSISSPVVVIRANGAPVIVHYYQGLQVATLVDDAWQVQELFRMPYGSDLSVAAGARGIFVSYYHSRGHGLMLAGPPELDEALFLPLVTGP